ncbi:MAG: VOC family protein [Fimbriimonas sp.]
MNPHICFAGCAREAVEFYQSVFGGEAHFVLVGDRDHFGLPPEAIFHAELRSEHYTLLAADGPEAQAGRISLHVLCTDREELERYFAGLSAGVSVHCTICEAFGGLFAMVSDRFGVSWYLTLTE